MDHIDSRKSDSGIDLECGEIKSGDPHIKELGCNGQHSKKLSNREWSVVGGLNGAVKGDDGLSSSKDVFYSNDNLIGEIEEKTVGLVKKKMMEEKWKKSNSKKPPKPPRPPGAPSLDEADMKLVREISQLAKLKHARIDRVKSLKRKRGDKASSSVINIFAMAITILFCCLIIFQGILGSHI